MKNKADRAVDTPWVEALVRLGYVARGTIYFVIGALALQLALGKGGATVTPTGAIDYIGKLPFGQFLLIVMAIGLVGYALWGLIRAFLDPLHKGITGKGLVARGGYLVSGASYALLAVPVILSLLHQSSSSTGGGSNNFIPDLWAKSYGIWLVAGIGVFWLLSGLGQLSVAYSASFMQDLNQSAMSAKEIEVARRVGRLGFTARGLVFLLISVVIFRAIYEANVSGVSGLYDAALQEIARMPFGQILLGVVAAGLVLFGIFSILIARWHVKTGVR